jgi:hypothetical protein
MTDRIFVNKLTGEEVTIVNEDVNFYELNDNVRIKKDLFYKKFEQKVSVDPNAFFQTKSLPNDPLSTIANQLKNLDTSKVSDEPTSGTKIKYTPPVTLSDNSMPNPMKPQVETAVTLSPEEKKAMLDEWRRTQPGAQNLEVQKNWDDEDDIFLNGDNVQPKVEPKVEPKVDPIQMMFKMFKNNYPVKLNVEIEENIPNPTFIKMVQENVEADAVEYYANLISDKLLKDPTKIKSQIYDQLKFIIDKELNPVLREPVT